MINKTETSPQYFSTEPKRVSMPPTLEEGNVKSPKTISHGRDAMIRVRVKRLIFSILSRLYKPKGRFFWFCMCRPKEPSLWFVGRGGGNKKASFAKEAFGDPGGARTLDPLIKSQLLYQLSYGVIMFIRFRIASAKLRQFLKPAKKICVFFKKSAFFVVFLDFSPSGTLFLAFLVRNSDKPKSVIRPYEPQTRMTDLG